VFSKTLLIRSDSLRIKFVDLASVFATYVCILQ